MTFAPAIQRTSARRSLLANCGWSLIGTVGFSAAQLGWIAAIAQLGTAAMVGRFALAMAITAPIVLLTNSALRTVQATDCEQGFAFGDYLGFRLVSITLAMLAIAAVACFQAADARSVLLAVGMLKAWESLGDVIHGDFQRRERLDLIGLSLLAKGLGSVLALAITLYLTGSISLASWAAASVFALVVLFYDVPALIVAYAAPTNHSLWPRWSTERSYEIFRLTAPLGVTVLLGALIANVPRYFIEGFLGEAPLGVFAALAWVAVIGQVLAGAVAHAVLPRLSQLFAARDFHGFAGFLRQLLLAGAACGGLAVPLAMLLGPWLLQLVFGPEYAQQSQVFVILVGATAFSIVICFLDHALYAARWFRVQVPINLAALVAMVVACWYVVPLANLVGAAWVICSIQAAQALARLLIVGKIVSLATSASLSANRERP